ncbi:hypothetical protein ACN4EG_21535 [Alkalinema pantanalense CENA528]|uniref:hypothetical protein n=1 Tax=Alkalinema pantanalense TaxID=1620705 RepID=UPI003D6E36D3
MTAPLPPSNENPSWQEALQKLYSRKSAERPLAEGDPRRYRDTAMELTQQRQEQPCQTGDRSDLPAPAPLDAPAMQQQQELAKDANPIPLTAVFQESLIEQEIVVQQPDRQQIHLIPGRAAWEILQRLGIESAYVFLFLVAQASEADRPWRSLLSLKGTDLLDFAVGEKQSDLTLLQKLKKLEEMLQVLCSLSVMVSYLDESQGLFRWVNYPMWLLEELSYSGKLLPLGESRDLRGSGGESRNGEDSDAIVNTAYRPGVPDELMVRLRPGNWVETLGAADLSRGIQALQQYGNWAKGILQINPNRKRLAARLAIFISVIGQLYVTGHYRVQDLLEQVEDPKSLTGFYKTEETRTRLFVRWNNALLSLKNLGWEIGFDPVTYPVSLRPSWSVSGEESGAERVGQSDSISQWFETWLDARLMIRPTRIVVTKNAKEGDGTGDYGQSTDDRRKASVLIRSKSGLYATRIPGGISGQTLDVALTLKGWSKAYLATQLKMDRSMVTHWIKGSRPITPEQRKRLWKLLGKELRAAQKLKY